MNTSAEAADQVVRMSLNGAEAALKITGSASKEVAKLLFKALKDIRHFEMDEFAKQNKVRYCPSFKV